MGPKGSGPAARERLSKSLPRLEIPGKSFRVAGYTISESAPKVRSRVSRAVRRAASLRAAPFAHGPASERQDVEEVNTIKILGIFYHARRGRMLKKSLEGAAVESLSCESYKNKC